MCVKTCQCNTCNRFNTCSDCEHNKDIKNVECMPPFGKGVQNCPHYKPFKHITIPKLNYERIPEDALAKMYYEPPIEIIRRDLEMRIENDTMKVIQQNGIVVDKDKLIKALKYDRDQYIKGFQDGKQDNFEELIEQVRTGTVRKMQKRLTTEIERFAKRGGFLSKDVIFWFIDQTAKELLGKENE